MPLWEKETLLWGTFLPGDDTGIPLGWAENSSGGRNLFRV